MRFLCILFLAFLVSDADGFIKCRKNYDTGSDEVGVFRAAFCAVRRDAGGGLQFSEGTEELCDEDTKEECFNPSPDVLCCRGDLCNANLKSTAYASYNPLRCPTGNGESPTELRNCQPGVKYCHYDVFPEDSFEVQCAPENCNLICDAIGDGCRTAPTAQGYKCCKPVEQGKNLDLDWGEAFARTLEDKKKSENFAN